MVKKKDILRGLGLLTGAIILVGLILQRSGILPLFGYEALLVVCFPIFVICVFLWWMAREHGEDIPFIGY